MDVNVTINGVLRSDLRVVRIRRAYLTAGTAELAHEGRHDASGNVLVRLWQEVLIRRTDTGAVLFRGNVTAIQPRGIAGEGVDILTSDKRFRLENEPVNINGRGSYIWNRRGYQCEHFSGEDSPGQDGGMWTAGEIAVDILEHALGVPPGGSAIPGHHSNAGCVTDAYLDSADLAGYIASEWLAMDTVVGEFSVSNTPLAQALDQLCDLAGGMYGWFVDAVGVIRMFDLKTLPLTDVEAGELGQWQDAGGTNYRLLNNQLEWSLDGVYTSVIVQGADKTVEVKPANIEGCANAALHGGGELELVAAPWRGWPCAYRNIAQPYRWWCGRSVGFSGSCVDWNTVCECGPPAGFVTYIPAPRIYKGTDAGPKTYTYLPGVENWRVNLSTGMIQFYWDVESTLGVGEKLWGWYWSRVPFTVTAGPDGNAYHCLGYERTFKVYDPGFKHTTSYPVHGTADDEVAMGILAARLLDQHKDIRVQGTIECDGVDPTTLNLRRRLNVVNLERPSFTSTTSSACWPDPADWARLGLNIVGAVYDFQQDTTELTVANTFFLLEEYSAMKERMKLNLFAQRELDLSEDIISCQTRDSSESPDDHGSSTTPMPPPPPGPTTTVPYFPPTTPAPPTTPPPGGTSTTLPPCNDCRDIAADCFHIYFDDVCDETDYTGQWAFMMNAWWDEDPEGYTCFWQGYLRPLLPPLGGLVELVFHPTMGWMILHGEKIWLKNILAMYPCDPTGTYTCTLGVGTATVWETPCATSTSTTAAPTTTSTTVAPTTSTSTTAKPITTTQACVDEWWHAFTYTEDPIQTYFNSVGSGAQDRIRTTGTRARLTATGSFTFDAAMQKMPMCSSDHYVHAYCYTDVASGTTSRARMLVDADDSTAMPLNCYYYVMDHGRSHAQGGHRQIFRVLAGVYTNIMEQDGPGYRASTWMRFDHDDTLLPGSNLIGYDGLVLPTISAKDTEVPDGYCVGFGMDLTASGKSEDIDDWTVGPLPLPPP